MDRRLSLFYDNFHANKIKPYIDNNPNNFPEGFDKQPGEITKNRWEVKKVRKYHTAPHTGKNKYPVQWKGYGSDDDEWINCKNISLESIQDF